MKEWVNKVNLSNFELENLWPFTPKRAITAFRFRTEFRLEPVWKPFERNLHSFERPGSSVQKNLHPFERLDHPFDRNVQPFEWLAHPFGKSIHLFERLAHPFDKNVQPFDRLTHPFVKNIQPFERLAHPFAGTSIRSNDLSMRQSYERLSFPVRVLVFLMMSLTEKKPSDHLNSLNRCVSKLQMKTTIL